MASGNSMMEMRTGAGWSRGLDNLLRNELAGWFGTRKWWGQILIWVAVGNLIPLIAFFDTKDTTGTLLVVLFGTLLGVGGPVGVCIMMQEALVGEKQAGTAAWVLSKPVSRLAFLASKLAGNAVGIAVTVILVPGLIAYLLSALLAHVTLPALGFLAGLGVHLVHILFYVGLTLMLGAFSDHRGPVIGVPMAFLFVQQFLPGLIPGVERVLPLTLVMTPGNTGAGGVATALMLGMPVSTYLPLYTTLAAGLVFVAAAAWAFQREEL